MFFTDIVKYAADILVNLIAIIILHVTFYTFGNVSISSVRQIKKYHQNIKTLPTGIMG